MNYSPASSSCQIHHQQHFHTSYGNGGGVRGDSGVSRGGGYMAVQNNFGFTTQSTHYDNSTAKLLSSS